MAKEKLTQFITEKGEVLWAKLKVQEEWQGKPTGKYTVTAKFPLEYTNKLLADFTEEYQRLAKVSDRFKGFKPARNTQPNFGEKELENGDIVFKLSTLAEFKNPKTDEMVKRVVPIFDAKGKKIDPNIGNGTIAKFAITMAPKAQSATNYGLSLWIDALQILELIEYGATQEEANAFGFAQEDGYVANTQESSIFDDGDSDEDVEDEVEGGNAGNF